MFNIGEKIIYGTNGAFTVKDIRDENVLGTLRRYYILSPVGGNADSRVYVPLDSEKLVSAMRKPVSREEAERIIAEARDIPEAEWKGDNRARMDSFRKIMESGDHRKMISVIKSVKRNSEDRKETGKKSYMTDENALKRAKKLLCSELALSLGASEDEVLDLIKRACGDK